MGLMDKAKKATAQASQIAQLGVEQGQARLEQAQGKHALDTLLRDLGEAVYAEQRQGGSHDAVEVALAALDVHHQQAGGADPVPGDSSTGER